MRARNDGGGTFSRQKGFRPRCPSGSEKWSVGGGPGPISDRHRGVYRLKEPQRGREDPMPRNGLARMGAAMLVIAMIAGACSKSTPPSTASKGTLASTFVFGAPKDCPTNKFCQIGLKNTYGIVFKEVRLLDSGGPLTVAALRSGTVQVGELFSTSIYDPNFVALVDDKHLEPA